MKKKYSSPKVETFSIAPQQMIAESADIPGGGTGKPSAKNRGNLFDTIGDSDNEEW